MLARQTGIPLIPPRKDITMTARRPVNTETPRRRTPPQRYRFTDWAMI